MGEKAEYRSAIRSRRMIREAYLALIQEKDMDKITVTDIITRADLNRGTFYAHYQDTHAVIEQIEDEIIGKIREIVDETPHASFSENGRTMTRALVTYIQSDLEFFRILINSRGASAFLDKLKAVFVQYMVNDVQIPKKIRETREFLVRIYFYAGGMVNLVQAWFRGELPYPLEEIVENVGLGQG